MSETGGPEHDFEPVPGLPETLPEGEYILWQGAPKSSHVSKRVLKSRWIGGYFVLLIIWAIITGFYDGRTLGSVMMSAASIAIMATIVISLLEAFAWGVQKTTLYTITNKRTVMRIGVALSATFNLPHSQVQSAEMAKDQNGDGDIALTLKPGHRLSYLVFWPHAKGWRAGSMLPRLVGLEHVEKVSDILANELIRTSREAALQSIKTDTPKIAVHHQPAAAE